MITALELRARYPNARIVVAAKFLPGDSAPEYASAWGGANWFPASRDNGPQEDWEAITYRKLGELATSRPESGIRPMGIRWHYEHPIDEVGIKTPQTGKLWYEELVGGLKEIEQQDLPEGTVFGFEMASFVIDVQKYLPWYVTRASLNDHSWLFLTLFRLQTEMTRLGIEVHRRVFSHINEAFRLYPDAKAVFNCTGLGSLTLGGVEDRKIFAARVREGLLFYNKQPELTGCRAKSCWYKVPRSQSAKCTSVLPTATGKQHTSSHEQNAEVSFLEDVDRNTTGTASPTWSLPRSSNSAVAHWCHNWESPRT